MSAAIFTSSASPAAWPPPGASLNTPEQVDLRLELGNVGSRGLAIMLDFAVRYGAILLLYITVELVTDFERFRLDLDWPEQTYALLFVIFFFVNEWFYFTLFEWAWNGQTPGKRLLGLRVIKLEGTPPTWMEVVLRNFFRPLDTSGPFALVGIAFIFFHPLRQRPGDVVGQTVVVRERPVDWEQLRHDAAAPEAEASGQPRVRLSPEAWELLHRYRVEQATLEPSARRRVAARLRAALTPQLGEARVATDLEDEPWLEEVARRS